MQRLTVWLAVAAAVAVSFSAFAKAPIRRAAAPSSKLEHIFVPDMLGAQLPYLETITGPAWRVDGKVRSYKADGCVVTVVLSNSNDVASLGLTVSTRCTFDLNKFILLGHKLPSANKLTFGSMSFLSTDGGRFFAACMPINCGNSADPLVTAHYELPHAAQFLEINAEVNYTNPQASPAEDNWKLYVGKLVGSEEPSDDDYSCGSNSLERRAMSNRFAQTAFKEVKITGLTIGYSLSKPTCGAH